MADEKTPCRSISPEGKPCVRSRTKQHMKHSDGLGKYWEQGINHDAREVPKNPAPRVEREDDGYMSEADYQSWGRL